MKKIILTLITLISFFGITQTFAGIDVEYQTDNSINTLSGTYDYIESNQDLCSAEFEFIDFIGWTIFETRNCSSIKIINNENNIDYLCDDVLVVSTDLFLNITRSANGTCTFIPPLLYYFTGYNNEEPTSTGAIIETEKILSSIITGSYTGSINYTYSGSQIISSEVNITSYLEEEKIEKTIESKVYIYTMSIINILIIIILYLSPYLLAYILAKKNFLLYNELKTGKK